MRQRLSLYLLVGVLLSMAGWTAHAQLTRTNTVRQSWEYKTITFFTKSQNATWSVWWEDGHELPLPVNGAAKRAELGNQGWELVAVANGEGSIVNERSDASFSMPFTTNQIQFYKRPK